MLWIHADRDGEWACEREMERGWIERKRDLVLILVARIHAVIRVTDKETACCQYSS
jgi:hypothetical protein